MASFFRVTRCNRKLQWPAVPFLSHRFIASLEAQKLPRTLVGAPQAHSEMTPP